ncbi:RNA polymerase sigma-70 factor [Mangrovibacterium lignilyticum]|uniref:RNA polymerase sigma-70 factor n=1 Tax=Mangrovibacterium lignilyticum TaxID=2668052 RepID=UPI0013D694BA|nr:RNA polymerase sigma-70 factor [Mangrovibacterium lignilyticum]
MREAFNQERIIVALAGDSQAALEELFNYYYPRLFNYSKAFLKFEDGVDDILQEVFLKIWRTRKNIKDSSTFNAYIYTITHNLLLNELRSRLNNQKMKDRLAKASIAQEYFLSESYEFNELKARIDRAVEALPEKQREIFRKSRIEGLSHKEIAEELKVSVKTVEYHIGQSIKLIKGNLGKEGELSLLYFYLFL